MIPENVAVYVFCVMLSFVAHMCVCVCLLMGGGEAAVPFLVVFQALKYPL